MSRTRTSLIVIIAAAAACVAAAACSSGGSGGGGGGGGQTAVSGKVTDGETNQAIAGVTLSGGGTQTTSDASGNWTLMLASNSSVVITATTANYLGSRFGVVVAPGGVTNVGVQMISITAANLLAGIVGLNFDSTKGEVLANFTGPGSGYTASLSAVHGSSITLNAGGNPIKSPVTVTSDGVLIVTNVVPGTTTVTAVPPGGRSCVSVTPAITSWPVDASVATLAEFSCQ